MRTWVYNNNTERRGVWHLPAGEIQSTDVPAHEKESERTLRRYHKRNCKIESVGYDFDKGGYQYAGCTCSLGDVGSVEIGKFTEVLHIPAYTKYGDVEALCGQVTIRDWVHYKHEDVSSKAKPGDRVDLPVTIQHKTYLFEGDEPPGPVCSRCLRDSATNG